MQDWEKQLAHAKAIRNATAICNDVSLASIQDPQGGLKLLKPHQQLKFNGKMFWDYMNDHGHDSADINRCKCMRRGATPPRTVCQYRTTG